MAEVTKVWGLWDCRECMAVGVSGKERRCPSCGSARDQDELDTIYLPPRDPVTNRVVGKHHYVQPSENSRVGHGPDTECPYCSSTVSSSETHCPGCGALQAGVKYPSRPEQDVEMRAPKSKRRGCFGCLGVLGGLFLAFVGFILWASATHEVPGRVVSMNWEHSTWLDSFEPTIASDWRSDIVERPARMPVNGQGEDPGAALGRCVRKHHHYDQVPDGTETVPVTRSRQVQTGTRESCSHSSNGDGSFTQTCVDMPVYSTETYTEYETRTKYRQVSVEQDWCDYKTHAWVPGPKSTVRGRGTENMHWPEMTPGALDRRRRSGSWSVIIEYVDDEETLTHDVEPLNETDYRAWSVGDRGTLVVDNLGGVQEVLAREVQLPPDPNGTE